MNRPPEIIEQIIEEWMFKRPLKYLQYTCDCKLCNWVTVWRSLGKKVVVYSDYPVKEKCVILGLDVDEMYSSEDIKISRMKPSTRGLELIRQNLCVSSDDILVVGDRMSKDGKMAEVFGCEYVILEKWKIFRNKKY